MAFSDLDHLRSRRLGELSGVAERDRLVMFRSSVAAFYPLPRRDFYRCGSCQRGRFRTRARWPLVCSEVKKIVDRMAEILFAAEIAFRRLDGGMSQQELNLLKFTTAAVAQLGTGSPQVVRCNMLQARFLAAASDYVPHNILRDAFAPHRSRPGDGSKNPPLRDASGHRPLIERGFDPLWKVVAAALLALVHADPCDSVHARIGPGRERRVPNGCVGRKKVNPRLSEPGTTLAQGGERWHGRAVAIEVIPAHAIQHEQHDHSWWNQTRA